MFSPVVPYKLAAFLIGIFVIINFDKYDYNQEKS